MVIMIGSPKLSNKEEAENYFHEQRDGGLESEVGGNRELR